MSSDKESRARILFALGQAYSRELNEEMIAIYSAALSDIPVDKLRKAAFAAMKSEKFFPAPAVLRQFAGCVAEDNGDRAWELVLSGIREVGIHQRVTFGPRINACIRQLGGWVRLCDTGREQLHTWTRKEFLRLYQENTDDAIDTPLDCGELYSHAVARYALPGAKKPDAPRLQDGRRTHDDGLGAKEAAE